MMGWVILAFIAGATLPSWIPYARMLWALLLEKVEKL